MSYTNYQETKLGKWHINSEALCDIPEGFTLFSSNEEELVVEISCKECPMKIKIKYDGVVRSSIQTSDSSSEKEKESIITKMTSLLDSLQSKQLKQNEDILELQHEINNLRPKEELINEINDKLVKQNKVLENTTELPHLPFVIVFICHDNNSVARVIDKNHYIMFVGDNEIDEKYSSYSKLIIARNLENNIEYEKKLLTFTAWYAISKNNLFIEYEYICILEYDVDLVDNFENIITDECNKTTCNVVSFINHYVDGMYNDIDCDVLRSYLTFQDINPYFEDYIIYWGSSSNQCVRRSILCDFVDFYYNSYSIIKSDHYSNLSWYHERVFMIYLKHKNIEYTSIENILGHSQSNSHNYGYN